MFIYSILWNNGKNTFIICIHERVRQLTHSLTQNGPSDSMENWITNFGVQIVLEAIIPAKTGFCEIPPLPPSPGGRGQKPRFWAKLGSKLSHYKEMRMEWLDLNTKKSFSAILEFSILRCGRGKKLNFKKFRFSNAARLQIISRWRNCIWVD